MSAEAQGIGNGDVNIRLNGYVGRIIKVAFRVGLIQTYSRGDDTVIQRHHTDDQFDSTSSTKGMTHLRLGGANECLMCFFLTHRNFDGFGLAAVVHGRTRAVGIDVNRLARLELGLIQSLLDGQGLCSTVGTRGSAMIGIAAIAIAAQFSIDLRATLFGMLVFFKKNNT